MVLKNNDKPPSPSEGNESRERKRSEYVESSDNVSGEPQVGFWDRIDSRKIHKEIKREFNNIKVNGEVGMRKTDRPPYTAGSDQDQEIGTLDSMRDQKPDPAKDNATIQTDNSSKDMSERPDKKPDQNDSDTDPLDGNSTKEIEKAMKTPNDQDAEQPEVDQENPEHSSGQQEASTAEIKQKYSNKIDQIKDAISAEDISDEFRQKLKSAQKLFEKYYLTRRDLELAHASSDNEVVQSYREELDNGLANKFEGTVRQLLYKKARKQEDYDTLMQILPDNMSEHQKRIKLEKEKSNHMPIAVSEAEEMYQSAQSNLVQDEDGNRWHMGARDEQAGAVKLYTAEQGEQDARWVSLVDDEMRTFGERFDVVQTVEEAENNQARQTASGESQESAAEKQNTEGNTGYSEKRPDESMFSYVYNQVDDEQRELLKQIRKELGSSEYQGIKRIKEKLANNPAEVLESVLGLKDGSARQEESFPKHEILQTLGSIESLNNSIITQEAIKGMVRAGYDSEWDIWQRVKAGHTYERQDGTFYTNLSGKKNGVWAKFDSREDYKKYRDNQSVKPIGRRRGIGDMLEMIEDDINEIKNTIDRQEQIDLSSIQEGDTVMLTEGGNGYEVTGVGEIAGSQYVKLKDGRAVQIQEVIKKEEESFRIENALTKAEVQEIIKNADASEPETVADEILKNDSFFWKEVAGNKLYAIRGQGQWIIYDADSEEIDDKKEQEEIEKDTIEGVRSSEVWAEDIAVDERVRSTIESFEQNSTNVIDKIIGAVPDPESAESETERQERKQAKDFLASIKQSIRTFRDRVSNKQRVSIEGIRKTRNSYTRLCNYTKESQPEIWKQAGLAYRRDVTEVVAEIDTLLENRS